MLAWLTSRDTARPAGVRPPASQQDDLPQQRGPDGCDAPDVAHLAPAAMPVFVPIALNVSSVVRETVVRRGACTCDSAYWRDRYDTAQADADRFAVQLRAMGANPAPAPRTVDTAVIGVAAS